MIDVSEALDDDDFSDSFIVKRISGSRNADGEWVKADPVLVPMFGSIQHPTDDDLMVLPEAERGNDFIRVFSLQELIKGDTDGMNSDRIGWEGKAYKVIRVRPWVDAGYWVALAVKVEEEVPVLVDTGDGVLADEDGDALDWS